MKKSLLYIIFAFLALAASLCLLLSSCNQKRPDSLRICFDIGNQKDMDTGVSFQEEAAKGFVDAVSTAAQLQGRDLGDIEVEVIPSSAQSGTEREAMLQRIRTEIMTGNGPDVFICCTEDAGGAEVAGSRLFPYLSKSISDGLFLPLDEYIDHFQLVDPAELAEPVFAGGKDREGKQAVAPLCYSIPCMVWEQGAVGAQTYSGQTWSNVLSGGDPVLSEQLRWIWPVSTFPEDTTRRDDHGTGLPYIYSDLLDYEHKKIGITEERLTALLKDSIPALRQIVEGEAAAPNWALFFSRFLSMGLFPTPQQSPENTDLSVIPLRNEQGGTTAVVSMYGAVSADTRRPEDAAFVVEYLLSEEYQSKGKVFRIHTSFGEPTIFININSQAEGDTLLTPATQESWRAAVEQINRVYFPTPADMELNNMLEEIQRVMRENYGPDTALYDFILGDISDEQLKGIVHEYYGKISRLLEEA